MNTTNTLNTPNILSHQDINNCNNELKTIFTCIQRMANSGLLYAGDGYCISMCDVIKSQLTMLGIESRAVEVSLSIGYFDKEEPFFKHVGFTGFKNEQNEVDTHVVIITDTNPPVLIDASISSALPHGKLAIIEEINNAENVAIDYPEFKIKLNYIEKDTQKVPFLHQMSIVDRIKTDQRVFKSLKFLKTLIFIAVTVSLLNASRGLYDFYQIYYGNELWGPSGTKRITDKINNMEELIKNLNNTHHKKE
jgi:hypothetical protein